MEPAFEIRLTKPAQFATGLTSREIRDHPSFCPECINLDPAVALELLLFQPERIWHSAGTGAVMVESRLTDIIEAAENGCSSCLLLKECVIAFGNAAILDRSENILVNIICYIGNALIVQFGDEGSRRWEQDIQIFVENGQISPWTTIGPSIGTIDVRQNARHWLGGKAKIIPSDPRSVTVTSSIKAWIGDCLEEHPWCDVSHTFEGRWIVREPYLPQRLLYLGSNDREIRLVETHSAQPSNTQYVALSYCWGTTRKLLTTTKNLASLKQCVPFGELIKTCQDAIHLVRDLGMQYLWIDSLCIIQDDAVDWERQAANMALVYAGAFLCIAATGGTDGDSGLFHPRPPTQCIRVQDCDGRFSKIYARKRINHHAFDWDVQDSFDGVNYRSDPADTVESLPLFKRGWAYQERILSPRILHFTPDELVWECLGQTNCECGCMDGHVIGFALRERRFVAGVPPDVEVRLNKLKRPRKIANRLSIQPNSEFQSTIMRGGSFARLVRKDYGLLSIILIDDHIHIYEDDANESMRWRALCQDYSDRCLPYATDSLPALSGLANTWAICQKSASNYYAGMWGHSIDRDLLWQYDRERAAKRNTGDGYLGPSWSWLNMRRAVNFLHAGSHDSDHHATILHIHCDRSADNSFGRVFGGYLDIKGPCAIGYLSVHQGSECGHGTFVRPRKLKEARGRSTSPPFEPDCVPECLALDDTEVLVMHYCTDLNDERSDIGSDRALVLQAVNGSYDLCRRIGIVARLGMLPHQPWASADVRWEMKTLRIV